MDNTGFFELLPCVPESPETWWLNGNCPSSAPSIHTAFNLIKGRKELTVNWLALDSFCLRHPLSFKHKCQCFKFIFYLVYWRLFQLICQNFFKDYSNALKMMHSPLSRWEAGLLCSKAWLHGEQWGSQHEEKIKMDVKTSAEFTGAEQALPMVES